GGRGGDALRGRSSGWAGGRNAAAGGAAGGPRGRGMGGGGGPPPPPPRRAPPPPRAPSLREQFKLAHFSFDLSEPVGGAPGGGGQLPRHVHEEMALEVRTGMGVVLLALSQMDLPRRVGEAVAPLAPSPHPLPHQLRGQI